MFGPGLYPIVNFTRMALTVRVTSCQLQAFESTNDSVFIDIYTAAHVRRRYLQKLQSGAVRINELSIGYHHLVMMIVSMADSLCLRRKCGPAINNWEKSAARIGRGHENCLRYLLIMIDNRLLSCIVEWRLFYALFAFSFVVFDRFFALTALPLSPSCNSGSIHGLF